MSSEKLTKKQLKALKHRGQSKRRDAPSAVPKEDLEDEEERPQKKRKRVSVDIASAEASHAQSDGQPVSKRKKKKEDKPEGPRYICFVGKLSYTVTPDQLAKHFEAPCSERPTVRLLTKKDEQGAVASKGAAFVEFKSSAGLQEALKLHRSSLGGRKINVELTAGGGGKGEARQAKLASKKARLDAQRATKPTVTAEKEGEADGGDNAEKTEPSSGGKNAKRKAEYAKAGQGARKKTIKPPKRPIKPALSGANAMKLG